MLQALALLTLLIGGQSFFFRISRRLPTITCERKPANYPFRSTISYLYVKNNLPSADSRDSAVARHSECPSCHSRSALSTPSKERPIFLWNCCAFIKCKQCIMINIYSAAQHYSSELTTCKFSLGDVLILPLSCHSVENFCDWRPRSTVGEGFPLGETGEIWNRRSHMLRTFVDVAGKPLPASASVCDGCCDSHVRRSAFPKIGTSFRFVSGTKE